MDITLQLKLGEPSGDVSEAGDIVNAGLRTSFRADLSASAGVKFYYVHVTGVPNAGAARLRRIRAMLMAADYEPDSSPDTEDKTPVLRQRRRWSVPFGALPSNTRNALLRDGEITVTWTAAKPFIRRKLVKIVRGAAYDSAQSEPVTDADLTNA